MDRIMCEFICIIMTATQHYNATKDDLSKMSDIHT